MKRSKRLTRSRSGLFQRAFAFALALGVPALSGCTVILIITDGRSPLLVSPEAKQ